MKPLYLKADLTILSWSGGSPNLPTYACSILPANDELQENDVFGVNSPAMFVYFSIVSSSPNPGIDTMGPYGGGGGITFLSEADAIAYFMDIANPSRCINVVVGYVNANTGTSVYSYAGFVGINESILKITQPLNSNLTQIAAITGPLSSDVMAMMAAANVAAVKTILGLTTIQKAYEGTTLRAAYPVFKSATVSGGTAVFQLTADGLSTGTALFPNGMIADSVNATVNDATASYQMSWAFTNSNKTLTVTANKLSTANILTGVLGQAAANAAIVKLSIWGY